MLTNLPLIVGLLGSVIVGVILLISHFNQKKAKKNRIQAAIMGTAVSQAAEKKQQAAKSADLERKLKEASTEHKGQLNHKITLPTLIRRAGYTTSVFRFWVYSALFATVSAFVMYASSLPLIALILFTFTAFFGMPRLYLKWKAKRRQKAFLEEFADALDAMGRLLKAGMPVTEAISMAGREFQGPIGDEMSQIFENQKIGISLADAVAQAAQRMPITEMKMFATAVAIQSETGSSLSEVLGNLSHVIRSRFRLKRKVVALSQEAKSSAIIIGSLPLLVGGGMNFMQPDYTGILFEEAIGKALLWGCAIWMSIGVLVMRQMINFKV